MLNATGRLNPRISAAICLIAGLFTGSVALAQTPIAPFTGDQTETFEGFAGGNPGVSFAVFGGSVTHNQLSGGTPFIWSSGGWGLGGNGSAQAADGSQGFGMNSNSTGEFVFSTPITSFGAYFGTAFPDDTMFLEFYDAGNVLIGSQQSWSYTRAGDGVLEWHGYDIGGSATRVVWGSLSGGGSAPAIDSIQISTGAAVAAQPLEVPTIPAYGLALTVLGTLVIASRRLRRVRKPR